MRLAVVAPELRATLAEPQVLALTLNRVIPDSPSAG